MADEVSGPGPTERVAWEGRSARGLTFNAFDGPLMAVGAMLAVIGYGLCGKGQIVIGVPLLVLGVYLAGGQLLIETYRRRRTRYVLTADDAYLIHAWPRHHTTVVDLRRCGSVAIRHHRDATATVTFGRVRELVFWVGPVRWERPAFRFIHDADLLMPVIRGESDTLERLEPLEPPEPIEERGVLDS